MPKKEQDQKIDISPRNTNSVKNDIVIDILGTSFSITAEEDKSYLEGILNNYRLALKNIQESSGLRDPLKLAVLTGFLLCDKIQRIYLKGIEEQGDEIYETKEAEQLTLGMIARISENLEAMNDL